MTDVYNLDTFMGSIDRLRSIDLAHFDDSGLPSGFKPTAAFRTVIEGIGYAEKMRAALALLTGTHGAGKTTAIRYYARKKDVLYWECRPGYQPKHLLQDIAAHLGISAGTGWMMQTSIVVEQLKASPRTFVLDEAQRLDYNSVDLLKYIADGSESTFVLCASPSLEKRIDKWPDIASRCAVRRRVSAMSLQEFLELYGEDGFTGEALTEMHRLTQGVMRVVRHLLVHVDEAITDHNSRNSKPIERGDLLPGHIRRIAEKVIG